MDLAHLAVVYETHLLVLVFTSLALLGAGFFTQGPRSHKLRIAGWVLFAAYWPTQAAHFFEVSDPVNAWFTLLGPLALLYVAYHEWKSLQWGEDPQALRWLAGASFISAATYFIIYKIEAVTTWLIQSTTYQSVWVLKYLFGVGSARTVIDASGGAHIYLGSSEYAVTVILACTAIQSIMIFVGAIYSTVAPKDRKVRAYLYTVPVIYVLNLLRNAGIVYGYKVVGWSMFGIPSFEWMHSYVMKIGSLIALVLIALAVFTTLPELHKNVLDVFDLPKRREPGFYDDDQPPRPPTRDTAPDAPGAET